MEEIGIKTIDINSAIRNSKSNFVKRLPAFVVKIIEKIICQDEMNAVITKYESLEGIEFINALLKEWNIKIIVKGEKNVPESGRYVFIANHPLGAIDSLSFLSVLYRFFPIVISPSNQLFNYIPQLRPVILSVNVFGQNTKETIDKINILFESEDQIMIFPAGEVSRKINGEISDPVWQKSFISKSIEHKRDVMPVHISGKNSRLFYFVAKMRKLLGIKLYIETILLPREMMKQKHTTITLTFGNKIPWQTFTEDKSHIQWARWVKETVYKIPISKH